MKNILITICLLFLLLFNAQQAFSQIEPCALTKVTTLPLAGEYGSFGQFSVTRQVIAHPDAGAPAPISVFVPSNASAANKVPVVFFAHGFGGTSYLFYETLMRQLAGNGYIVVFSPYTASLFSTHAARYNQLWNGFQKAAQDLSSIMDLTKTGFAGHSYGAGATPEMARRGLAQGWGANGLFLFVMAAWYNWGTNLDQIPATAKMVVQVYWDDPTNEHLISQNDIWNRLPQITEKKWQVIRASKIYCSLEAAHGVPVTNNLGQTDATTDAYDAWGVWRRIHALSVYTFTGNQAARTVAFGDDASMGKWNGIFRSRQIAPLESTDTPVLNTSSSPSWTWGSKCTVADPGTPCP
ncbi:MAG: hypothetical protein ACR2F2_09910 [Pyrinomonadaceae bacterium]